MILDEIKNIKSGRKQLREFGIIIGLIVILLKPVYKAWMFFGLLMGWVMTRVILSILFYLVISPLGLVLRMSGKQFLDIKFNKLRESYWKYREEGENKKDDFEKQY